MIKPVHQATRRFCIPACIALACLALTSGTCAATTPQWPVAGDGARQTDRAAAAPKAVLLAQSDAEQKMIDDCRNNFGTDCERAVDTELAAEQNEQRFIRPKPAQ